MPTAHALKRPGATAHGTRITVSWASKRLGTPARREPVVSKDFPPEDWASHFSHILLGSYHPAKCLSRSYKPLLCKLVSGGGGG